METPRERSPTPTPAGVFATTHWSVVMAATGDAPSRQADALEQLCRTYWLPIYAFIRRQGHTPVEAEDLTQEFFARLLEKDFLSHLKHRDGKFRSFLLKFLQHFLADEWDKARAGKRGGGQTPLSLDGLSAEEHYRVEPADPSSPEQAFERHWAQIVIQRSLDRLGAEYAATGKRELFDLLKDYQPGERGALTNAQLAARLGMSESATKVALHRLHRRHRDLLREEIGHTVSSPGEVEDEIRHLLAVLGG